MTNIFQILINFISYSSNIMFKGILKYKFIILPPTIEIILIPYIYYQNQKKK